MREQVYKELLAQDKQWKLEEVVVTYETELAHFVKTHPEIAEKLSSVDISSDDSCALVRGMIGAMKENSELSGPFVSKIAEWTKAHEDHLFWSWGLDEFVKSNPNKAKDMFPLLEVISNNPPKRYTQKSIKEASYRLAWECKENTKGYFLLAKAVITAQPSLVDKVDAMVGKFKKTVSLLDAISAETSANGRKNSERTPNNLTYYHDRYMKAHLKVRKMIVKNNIALNKGISCSI